MIRTRVCTRTRIPNRNRIGTLCAVAFAITTTAALAACRDKTPPATGDTNTTGIEVQRRQGEAPSVAPGMGASGTSGAAGASTTEGSGDGVMNDTAGAVDTTMPPTHHQEPADTTDHLSPQRPSAINRGVAPAPAAKNTGGTGVGAPMVELPEGSSFESSGGSAGLGVYGGKAPGTKGSATQGQGTRGAQRDGGH